MKKVRTSFFLLVLLCVVNINYYQGSNLYDLDNQELDEEEQLNNRKIPILASNDFSQKYIEQENQTIDEELKANVEEGLKGFVGGFLENKGQKNEAVYYYTESAQMAVGFGTSEIRFSISNPRTDSLEDNDPLDEKVIENRITYTTVKLELLESYKIAPIAKEPTGIFNNYFLGSDESKWGISCQYYTKVIYYNIYEKIDLVYELKDGQLKYEFFVHPGGNLEEIKLQWTGPVSLELLHNGIQVTIHQDESSDDDLSSEFSFIDTSPISYQSLDRENPIVGTFNLLGPTTYGFDVPTYNPKKLLIIDPLLNLTYSTYVGGNNNERGKNIALDGEGNVYVTGTTASANFPTVNAYNTTSNGNDDVFVFKLNSTGNGLLFSTYIGGSNADNADDGGGIAVDEAGDVYVTGNTQSTDFPTVNANDTTHNNNWDVFVLKLAANGSSLLYSTYVGGNSEDKAYGIALDGEGNIYVIGDTLSSNFPAVNAYNATSNGNRDVFVFKLNSTGNSLLYSTYVGGSARDYGRCIALDVAGITYVSGYTESTNFPAVNALNATYNGGIFDAFVFKLTANGDNLLYSTYVGGTDQDRGESITLDKAGNAYVTGVTWSTDFPTVNAYNTTINGARDLFVFKLNSTGNGLFYSTYIGGNNEEDPTYDSIVVDVLGNAYVTGRTVSTNFPAVNAYNSTGDGNPSLWDVFVFKLNSTGNGLLYSTYIGGSEHDMGNGIMLDGAGNAYVVGDTMSTDFPTVNAYNSTGDGYTTYYDMFVLKLAFYHNPIYIDDNADFANLGFPGNGTASNPYCIEGYHIANSTADLIHIQDTTVYFNIRYNHLNGINGSNIGIYFNNVTHGTITNSTILSCQTGIYLNSSSGYNIISDNFAYNNTVAIRIAFSSDNNTVTNNTLDDNFYGVYASDSNNCTITNNNCSANTRAGIVLNRAANNTVVNNNIQNGGIYLFGWTLAQNLQKEVSGNTINGKPIIFWQNIVGSTVPPDAGQIILVNCSKINIINQTISNAISGLYSCFSTNLFIHKSNFSNNLDEGLWLHYVDDVIISKNNIFHNGYDGFLTYYSENITISGNNVYNNSNNGISTYYTENSTISKNNIFNNSLFGVYLSSSINIDITRNSITTNLGEGVHIQLLSNITLVKWNNFVGNKPGQIQAYDNGSSNTFIYNYWDDWTSPDSNGDGIIDNVYNINGTVNNNDTHPLTHPYYGYITRDPIDIDNDTAFGPSGYNFTGSGTLNDPYLIEGFNITDPNGYLISISSTTVYFEIRNNWLEGPNNSFYRGIFFSNVEHGFVINNTLSFNYYGICLSDSINNTISSNTVFNTSVGIYLGNSPDNTVLNNTVFNNSYCGISLDGSSNYNNTIFNNTIFDNPWFGIVASSNCTIEHNTIFNNYRGIYIANDEFVEVIQNFFFNNGRAVELDTNSFNNTVYRNIISDSTQWGIYVNVAAEDNRIYLNDFINNNDQAYVPTANNNNWSDGTYGNYWSDYTGVDANGDGIGDTAYDINAGEGIQDPHPLMESISFFKFPHDPIFIDGDIDFAAQAADEEWRGSGTSEDPYIIEYYTITNKTTNLIEIRNTTVYFNISNCLFNGINGSYNGIFFQNVTNGAIINNILSYSKGGIVLDSSNNNSLAFNIVHTIENDGIVLFRSDNNTISYSTVYNNSQHGIKLENSSHNNLFNNLIYNNNETGITLRYSNNTIVFNNTIYDSNQTGLRLTDSFNNILSQNIIFNNTQGTYSDAISLSNSGNNTLSNNTLFNNIIGIFYMYSSSNNNLSDNTIYNNSLLGILLWNGSNNNILSNNTLFNNSQAGIELYISCVNNTIHNNTIYSHNDPIYGVGIFIIDSNDSYITNNVIFSNSHGIVLNNSINNYVYNNSIYKNLQDGIELWNASFNNVSANIIYDNIFHGIYLNSSSNNNLISGNKIYNNSFISPSGGIGLFSSADNIISYNSIYNNSNDGIYLLSASNNNTIKGNTLYNNFYDGIFLNVSINNSIYQNNIYNNSFGGIWLHYFAYNNTIYYNTIIANNQYGIGVSSLAEDNYIYRNSIQDNIVRQASDYGTSNVFIYNCWSDWLTPDDNLDGIVDSPYIIFGTANTNDSFPLIYPFKFHVPIAINDNSGFATYGFTGDGTQSNPYIIEGYNITTSITRPIDIRDTSVYFIIRNCLIRGNGSYYGIYLLRTSHAIIENNWIYTCTYGILIENSSQHTIFGNIIGNNTESIYLHITATDITISNNTLFENNFYGIHLWYSPNNNLSYNLIFNNSVDGIKMENSSDSCIITANTIYNNGWHGITIASSNYSIISSNIIFNNSKRGIYLWYSNITTISANTITFNSEYGVMAVSSIIINISNNIIANNSITGLELNIYSSVIFNNIIDNNSICGIWISGSSSNNIIFNNTISHNGNVGFYLLEPGTINNTLSNNTLSHNLMGVVLYNTTNNIVINNFICNSTYYGIYMAKYASSNNICNNLIWNNEGDGIYLNNSNMNSFTGNLVYSNLFNGFVLNYSQNNVIFNNTISQNNNDGFHFFYTFNNTLINNTVSYNNFEGISLEFSYNNTFANNSIFNNLFKGIKSTATSANNTFTGNSIHNNTGSGIYIESSSQNIFRNNTIYDHTYYGVFIETSTNYNAFIWNDFLSNNIGGSQAYDSGSYNNFTHNYWNDHTGLDEEEPYGIFDNPYNIDGDANNADYFPLTLISEFLNVTIESPLAQVYNTTDTITVSLSGNADNYWYYIEDFDTNNQTYSDIGYRTLPDGLYTLHAYGNDSIGNIEHDSVSFRINLNPPNVIVIYPNGNETVDEIISITWTVSDTEGLNLTYFVYYWNGNSWVNLENDITDTSLFWDTTTVSDRSDYKVRVNASDGFLTGVDESNGTFTIDNNPTFQIIPTGYTEFTVSDTITVGINVDETVNVTIQTQVSDPPSTPTDLEPLDIYLNITLSDPEALNDLWINVSFVELNGRDPNNVKIYYYNEDDERWLEVKRTGVDFDNEVVWAWTDHLTLFGVMATQTQPADNWLTLLLMAFILIIPVIVATVFIYRRAKKRMRMKKSKAEIRQSQIDLGILTRDLDQD